MITDELEKLIAKADPLSDEALVLAAVARRLASEMDRDDVAPYVLGALARELRAAVASLSGTPGGRPGLSDSDFAELLRGL